MPLYIVFITIIFASYFLFMILLWRGWNNTNVLREKILAASPEFISVILPVRNEATNIQQILRLLSTQDYPKDKYEIIVVDDFSEDETSRLTETCGINNLKLIKLTGKGGKKHAITVGVKNSKGNLIVTTDADCEMRECWLSSITNFFRQEHVRLIVAPVLLKTENTFFSIIQSQEMTLLTACAGASLYYNRPLLCSGANLAYTKETFWAVHGYEGNEEIPSGDDVFLMSKVQAHFPGSIKYLKSPEAAVYTHPAASLTNALSQRKRWASKTFIYGNKVVIATALLVFSVNFFLVLLYLLFLFGEISFNFLLAMAALKISGDSLLLLSANNFFKQKNKIAYFLLTSLIYPVYVMLVGLKAPFARYNWRGRKIQG